jgi:hypothetical protein
MKEEKDIEKKGKSRIINRGKRLNSGRNAIKICRRRKRRK